MDPITLAALGLAASGVSDIGGSLGLWDTDAEKAQELANKQAEKDWERQEARRKAIQAYLGGSNAFKAPDYQFDINKFSDVLNPIQEQNQMAQRGLNNRMALAGQAQGGVGTALMSRLQRKQGQDFSNTLTGLRRTDEQDSYQRALQQYLGEWDRMKTIAQYQ